MRTQADTIEQVLRRQTVLRAKEARAKGISATTLRRLVERGQLVRIERGLYAAAQADGATEHHSLVAACLRLPKAVVCLLSALSFHRLGTQTPHEVWLAIDRKAARPLTEQLPLHVVRFSGRALTDEVERHRVEGVEVRVYSAEKTVADCFKYRNKVGLDVALEALREYLRRRDRDIDRLHRCALLCRVDRVMRPYLEAMT